MDTVERNDDLRAWFHACVLLAMASDAYSLEKLFSIHRRLIQEKLSQWSLADDLVDLAQILQERRFIFNIILRLSQFR